METNKPCRFWVIGGKLCLVASHRPTDHILIRKLTGKFEFWHQFCIRGFFFLPLPNFFFFSSLRISTSRLFLEFVWRRLPHWLTGGWLLNHRCSNNFLAGAMPGEKEKEKKKLGSEDRAKDWRGDMLCKKSSGTSSRPGSKNVCTPGYIKSFEFYTGVVHVCYIFLLSI